MFEQYDEMLLRFQDFKKSLADFKHEAGNAVLYKLLAFEVIENMVENLEESLSDAHETLKQYAYEQ